MTTSSLLPSSVSAMTLKVWRSSIVLVSTSFIVTGPLSILASRAAPSDWVMPVAGTPSSSTPPRVPLSTPSVLLAMITASAPAALAAMALSPKGHTPRSTMAILSVASTPSYSSAVQPVAVLGATSSAETPSSGVGWLYDIGTASTVRASGLTSVRLSSWTSS